jgi:mono/diheme cytochrome c family protein
MSSAVGWKLARSGDSPAAMKVPAHTPILSLLFLLMFGPAQAQDPARHGRALLKEFCARCHAIGAHGRSPHREAVPFRYLGRSFDLDEFPRALERGISSAHPDMPIFKFSEQDARDVRDYLRTIQR